MKLLITDDDALIRESLKLSLSREEDITVCALAKDGAEAVDLCKTHTPDVVLMDIRMPGTDGIAATRLIKERFPATKIMMLTTFDDRPIIQQALAAGADGYLLKTDKIANISHKLRLLLEDISILGSDVLKKLTPQENPLLTRLTPRERDIARLVSLGKTNKEIAAELFLSEGTVRNNVVIVMEKLEVSNRTQLSTIYLQS
ncbi:MAG: response regulator transcription factor [Defluviitaleaceae bacterium]|nr:response regulator transcription factor [Defluviitaleaceae bacterium]MCL2275088.1 response regulator transcription factor [Defluviitaleaceae bacterium]